MSMFVDIVAALLACAAAACWILSGRGKLPPNWDPLSPSGDNSVGK
jgi:hypothetical protein